MSRKVTFEDFRDEWLKELDEVIEAHGGWPLVGSVKEDNELAMGEDAR